MSRCTQHGTGPAWLWALRTHRNGYRELMDTGLKEWKKAAPLLRVSVWLQSLPLALGLVSGFSEWWCETCELSGFTDTSQVLSLRCQAALARLGDQRSVRGRHTLPGPAGPVRGRGVGWGSLPVAWPLPWGWSSAHVSCRLDRPGAYGWGPLPLHWRQMGVGG